MKAMTPLRALALAALLLPTAPALAAEPLELLPSAAAACLHRGAVKLEYPADALRRREGGAIDVDLTFAALDAEPRFRALDENVASALLNAVREHVRQYRVPCMAPGAPPVTLRQTFVFRANGGQKVVESSPRDASEAGRREQSNCLTHVADSRRPEFGRRSQKLGEQGAVVLRVTFTAPDAPPGTEVLDSTAPSRLRAEVVQFAAGWRLPCLTAPPLSAVVVFNYEYDGDKRRVLRDMPLQQFLAAASELPLGVYFDLGTLGCPFDLRVTYKRPYDANVVDELERSLPERRPFLDWLSKVQFGLSKNLNLAIVGQTFDLHVPCAVIDL